MVFWLLLGKNTSYKSDWAQNKDKERKGKERKGKERKGKESKGNML